MRTIRYAGFPVAVIIYAAFAVYLYQPYFKHFDRLQYLTIINLVAASAGCYVLSRRWVGAWWASVFAGAVYGFSPLSLILTAYHPTAGSVAASIPWLFLPAAFHSQLRRRWISYLAAVFPFVFIILFFNVAAYFGLFPIPVQPKRLPCRPHQIGMHIVPRLRRLRLGALEIAIRLHVLQE